MKTQNIIIAHPKTTAQANVIKAFMEALKIKFEVSKKADSPYKKEFVAKIEKSKKEIKNGDSICLDTEDLSNFLGL